MKFFEKTFMLLTFITTSKNILSSAFDTPYVNLQPTIYMPTVNPDGTCIKTHTAVGQIVNILFALEFSLNYRNPKSSSKRSIDKRFDLSKSTITLKKFIEKDGVDEVYDPRIHKPRTLFVTDNKKLVNDFTIFIADKVLEGTHGDLSSGSQMFSMAIATSNKRPLSKESIQEAIDKFKHLLYIKDETDCLYFAYQFSIEIPYKKSSIESNFQEKIVVYTNLFQIFLYEDEFLITTEETDSDLFHIPSPNLTLKIKREKETAV